jgi:hypothetical protein
VAERSPVFIGEHGAEPTSAQRHNPMANGVDAPMKHVEAPGLDPALNRSRAQARREQLPASDNAVLASCQLCDFAFALGA